MILIVIPARGGSKGLKDKNLRKLMGHSLIGRAVLCAKEVKGPKRIVTTTDSKLIKIEAEAYGSEVPFIRTEDLASDLATTEDTLRDALERSEKIFGEEYEFVVYFSPSEGFLDPACVNRGVKFLSENSNLESYFPGRSIFKNFWQQQEGGANYIRLAEFMRQYSSRQQKRPIYREDTGRGLVTRPELWKNGHRIGNSVMIEFSNDVRADLDIHTELDLRIAELVLSEIGDHSFIPR